MNQEFKFYFKELKIEVSDITDLLGYKKMEIPDPFPEYITEALGNAEKICNIRAGFHIFDNIEVHPETQIIQINNQSFHPGKIVTTQLSKSEKIAVFVCTAGHEIMDYSRKISIDRDPLLGYIYDVIGSVVVEKAADKMENKLQESLLYKNLNLSDRFSPGYCDWLVAEQKQLFDLLPPNFCQVSLSDSCLMSPIKSVSGFIGIGSVLKQSGYQCNWCDDENCIYGKIRRKKVNKN